MNKLVEQDMSIIMISSELPEVLGMSDRIYVMADGKFVGGITGGSHSRKNYAVSDILIMELERASRKY